MPWLEAFQTRGWAVLPPTPACEAWVRAALNASLQALPGVPPDQWRSGGTWCVGLDLLDNDGTGALCDGRVQLRSRALRWFEQELGRIDLHRAQVSVVRPGYPKPMPGEGDAAFRFRQKRDAAHVDGLHRREDGTRFIAELHDFILGLPLTCAAPGASPLVVYDGSHTIMTQALRQALRGIPQEHQSQTDVTQAYAAARRVVFETCPRVVVDAAPGAEILLHRHMLHGIAPWTAPLDTPDRLIAYFRPATFKSIEAWLGGA